MQKRGLGRGLSALIPDSATNILVGGRTIVNIDIHKIVPNQYQPREDFHQESIDELAESIKAQGIVQPILVRPNSGKYELVAGERRWRAAKKAGLSLIPAIIKDLTDEESLEIALVENIQREDLNPMDEAEAYNRLGTEFHKTQAEIAKRVGKDRSTIANIMRLLDLPKEIQTSIRKKQITLGHAKTILGLESDADKLSLWKEIMKSGLSVRDTEQIVRTTSSSKGKKKKTVRNDELRDLTEILTTHFGTKVNIHGSSGKGKIEIRYYSQEDLERIIEALTGSAGR